MAVASAAADASAAEARVMVAATVLKHARMNITEQPATLEITAADVARGYVEVAEAGQISVRSNSPGFMLEFAVRGGLFRRISVGGLGQEVELDAAGGIAARPAAGPGVSTTMKPQYRFMLAASARPGIYAWPMRLSVTAL
ncbi:MAG: hypothetical protein ACYC0T_10410 [Ramlibacter sp.]